jgi:Protein of unknown function (DUF3485)
MWRTLPVVAIALPLVLAYGVMEGLWSDRWQLSKELEQAPQRLASLPLTIGSWQGEDVELDARLVRQGEMRGHLLRRYVQPRLGETVTVLAVVGRSGPVAVHTPYLCYGGAGFVPVAARTRYRQEAETPAEFWSERYQKDGAAIPEQLQIYYAWNTGKGWVAVDNARLHFASARTLYKLYVVRTLPRLDEPAENDPIPGFLEQFLPELDRCLFKAS